MSSAASAPSSTKTTLFHLALIIPWVAIVINSYEKIIDNSFLWHIRAGTLQMSSGRVLTEDPFSFTMAGAEWRTQSWLVELGYGWLEGVFGLDFTAPMVLVVSALAFAGILLLAYRSSRSVASTAIVGLLSAVILPRFLAPRPVLFSFALFVLVLLAWEDKRSRWSVPFLFWLWAAIHGSFVIGLVYLAARIVQKRDWSRGVVVATVSGVATLGTAHGLGVISMLLSFRESSEYLTLITEWAPPNFLEPDLLPFVAAILIITYGATRGRIVAGDLWVLAPFTLFAFTASRSVGIAWVALIPLLARALGPGLSLRSRGFGRPIVVLSALVVLVLPFLLAEGSALDAERFPVAAVESLEDVNTFHGDAAGGYLIWREAPAGGVFIDDRVELFGPRLEEMVELRTGQRDWRPVFARDGVEQALLEVGEPLEASLQSSGWTIRHADDSFVVLVSPES